MEIAVADLAGSLGGGGRYDNLIGMFLGRDVPACGFSLGLERIIVVMTERKMFPATVAERRRRRDGDDLDDGTREADACAGRELRAGAVCASTCTRRPTSSGSSSSTRRAAACRSWRLSATMNAARGEPSRIRRPAERRSDQRCASRGGCVQSARRLTSSRTEQLRTRTRELRTN